MIRKATVFKVFIVGLVAVRSAIAADATELFALGALQIGNAGAGVASPQDASWSLLNPAALVDLDRRLDTHLEMVFATFQGEPGGTPLASNLFAGEMHDNKFIPVPSGGVVWPLKTGTLALGIYGVQGNRVDYPYSRSTLGLPIHADRRMHQDIVKMPIAYGYQFDNGWSLGAALVPAVSRFRTDSLTLRLLPTSGNNEWDWSFGAGVKLSVYKRWDKWSLGGTWTSRTFMTKYDKYDDIQFWSFDLPAKLQAGIAYRPIPKLEFLLDYKWINWSSINVLGHRTIGGGLGLDNQHIIKTGITWKANDRWTLRGGVAWGSDAIQDGFVFANILTPATTQWHLGTGVSFQLNEHSSFHLAFSHALPNERVDNGRGDLFSYLAKGSRIAYEEESVTLHHTLHF